MLEKSVAIIFVFICSNKYQNEQVNRNVQRDKKTQSTQ